MITITRRQLAGLLLLTLMWGFMWPIMKFSLRELPPLHYRAATMAAGALVLAAWYARKGVRRVPRGTSEWRDVVVLGLPNMLGWRMLSLIGVAHLPTGRAAKLQWADSKDYRDPVMAATGLVHGAAVVTRNTKHFEATGVRLVNPWESMKGAS